MGLYNRPGADIKEWAKDEAKARNAVKEKGGEVEWGKHYGGMAKFSFEKEEVGAVPSAADE